MDVIEYARRYLAAGVSVIPVATDGTKRPAGHLLPREPDPDAADRFRATWRPYQSRLATDDEAARWWGGPSPAGLAAVCGAASGGLELIDFDADADLLFPAWLALVGEAFDSDLAERLCVVRTPREPAGYHVWLRCPDAPTPGNQKLARDGKACLVETRGEGGYALVPGCPPACHETGRPYEHVSGPALWGLPPVTADERETLVALARSLTRDAPAPEPTPPSKPGADLRPGDDFDARGWDWAEILEPHGWTLAGRAGDERRWARPGKRRGWSATTGHCRANGADLLRVFTTSTEFDAEKAYGKFRAFALLNHRGDLSAAARALRQQGFGSAPPARLPDTPSRPPAQAAGPRPAPPRAEAYAPLPLDALPAPLARLASEASAALGCDPAYVALPALAVCAGAIGNSRALRLRRDWAEPCVLWTAVVGDSGSLKTPAYNVAMAPAYAVQAEMRQEYRRESAEHRRASASDEDAGERPVLRRVFASDVTIEKLAEMVEDNPRGLLISRDELRGWFGSFSRYRGPGADSDLGNWLSAYNAGPIVYDRKTGERRSVFVERGSLSVTGTIQPGVLARCLTGDSYESGLAARILMAWPGRRRKRWTEAEVSAGATSGYEGVVRALLSLPLRQGDRPGQPDRLLLSDDARRAWVAWYEEWAEVQHGADGELLAAYSKLEGAAARLALVHHVVTMVDLKVDDAKHPVSRRSVEAGAALARWFGREVRRIYAALTESESEREGRRLLEWLAAHGGRSTVKQLQRSNNRLYGTADDARAALEALAAAGLGRWESRPAGPRGGRPTEEFVLTPDPCTTHDETDGTPPASLPDVPPGVSSCNTENTPSLPAPAVPGGTDAGENAGGDGEGSFSAPHDETSPWAEGP